MDANEQVSAETLEDSKSLTDYEQIKTVVSELFRASPPSSPMGMDGPPLSLDVISVKVDHSPKDDSLVEQPSDESQQLQQPVPSLSDEKKYRIHLGTRPGFYQSELFTYQQSQWRHEQLVDLLNQLLSKMEKFQFKIPLSSAFSTTEAWGLEPYASVVFDSCTRETVEGVAAIIGRIFRQDAVGIFDDDDDEEHRVFAITGSNDSSIPNYDAHAMMMAIQEQYPYLSAQFGKSNATIEFHDFCDRCNKETVASLQQIVDDLFKSRQNNFYQIKESTSKSSLLEEEQYTTAIEKAGFQLFATIIETVRLHDTVFNCN